MSSEEVLAYQEGLKNRGFLPTNFGSSEGEIMFLIMRYLRKFQKVQLAILILLEALEAIIKRKVFRRLL